MRIFDKKDIYYTGTFKGLKSKIILENQDDILYLSIMQRTFINIGNVNTYFDSKRPLIWFKTYDNYNNCYVYTAFPLKNTNFIDKAHRGYAIGCDFSGGIRL